MRTIASFARRLNEALDVEEIHAAIPGLHPWLVGARFVVLADLHMARLTPYHTRIYDAVRQARPDCILIAGDVVDNSTRSVPDLAPFFAHLAQLAPCAAVLGNNDCHRRRTPALRSMYQEAGVTLLENETRLLALRRQPVRITGLTDPSAFHFGVHRDRPVDNPKRLPMREALQPGRAREDASAPIPTILLMHQPQLARQYAELSPSLIVAGHAHGGQIQLPMRRGLFAPGQGFFAQYTSGLYQVDGAHMVVSRGLGNHGFPLRIHNPPHVPVVVWE